MVLISEKLDFHKAVLNLPCLGQEDRLKNQTAAAIPPVALYPLPFFPETVHGLFIEPECYVL